jgi:signal transduction histidine kinase
MDPVESPQTAAPPPTSEVTEAIQTYLSALRTVGDEVDGSAGEYLALEEVAEIVAREQDAGRLAAASLKKARSLLDLAVLRLYRVDERGGDLRLAAGHAESPEPAGEANFARSLDAFRKRSRRQKGSVSVEEVAAEQGTTEGRGVAYSVLSIPIFNVEELWGVLQAAVPSPRAFRPSEARIIEVIAGLVGVGIMRLEAVERQAALRARIDRKGTRLIELHRRLRHVRANLEATNRSYSEALGNLREVEKLKDAFVSSISHEMRTPLTIIRSYIDLLLHYEPGSREKATEFLKVVDAETVKLLHHINKILCLTEIRANDVRLYIDIHAVEEIVRSALAEAAPALDDRDITVDRELDVELPRVLVDREKMAQILVDLLDNAAKFSRPGSTVTVGAREAPRDGSRRSVTIWVADTGSGIAIEDQGKIFEQFVQITNAAAGKPRGIGLGLPICRAYVERMGGTLWVESAPGAGSTFFVTLPAADETPRE